MWTTSIRRGLAGSGLLLLMAACGGASGDVVDIPHPDLDGVDPAVAEQLRLSRERLDGAQGEERLAAYLDLGGLYLTYGLYPAAESCFDNATRVAPDSFDAHYYLAVTTEELGRQEQAVERYRRALQLRSDYPAVHMRLGEVLLGLSRLDEAQAAFERAAGIPGYEAAGAEGLGRVAMERGETEVAVARFEEALAIQPEADRIHYQLGLAYRRLGDAARAEKHLEAFGQRQVAFRDPLLGQLAQRAEGKGTRQKIGFSALQQQRYDKAVDEYRKAVEADPGDAEARQNYGLGLWRAGRVAEALAQYVAAAELAPEDPHAQRAVGMLLVESGRPGEALQPLDRALALDPDFIEARLVRARALGELGRTDEALAEYDRVLTLDPNHDEAVLGRPAVLRRSGRVGEAIEMLRAMLSDDPGNAAARVELGLALRDQGDPELALQLLDEAAEAAADPRVKATAFHNLATTRLEAGDVEGALKAYRQALQSAPEEIDTRLQLASLLARSGRFEAAAAEFRQLREVRPGEVRAWLAEATALVLARDFAGAIEALEGCTTARPDAVVPRLALARLLASAPGPGLRDASRALDLVGAAPESPEGLEIGALALAELGRYDEAAEWQSRAIAKAEQLGQPGVLEAFRRNLERYRSGEPALDPWGS